MSYAATFWVQGEPGTKGSHRALMHNGRPIVIPMCGAKERIWERAVKLVASRVAPTAPLDCPVRVAFEFALLRPAKPKFAAAPAARLDLDKLARSTGDALTGLMYVDDARIVEMQLRKRFCTAQESQGAQITVEEIADTQKELPL